MMVTINEMMMIIKANTSTSFNFNIPISFETKLNKSKIETSIIDCKSTNFMIISDFVNQRLVFFPGLLFNAICVIIFVRIIIKEKPYGHMFKYLLVKAINDTIFYASHGSNFFITFNKREWSMGQCIQLVWFSNYLENINQILSGLLEIAATLDCFLTISNRFKCCHKSTIYFCINTMGLIVLSSLFSLYSLYTYEMIFIGGTICYTKFSKFHSSELWSNLNLIYLIIRDVVILVILLVLNILIFRILREATRRRKLLRSGYTTTIQNPDGNGDGDHQNKSNNFKLIRQAQHAECKKIIMILFIGVNYFVFHFPIFFFTLSNIVPLERVWLCKAMVIKLFFNLSYISPLFIYLYSNRTFRKYFFNLCSFR
jgi:hypothetical protein